MPQNNVTVAERSGHLRFSRTEDRHDRNAQQRRQMHRSGIVGQEQTAFAQLVDKLLDGRLADAIDAALTKSL
jgi:hypothetical protein